MPTLFAGGLFARLESTDTVSVPNVSTRSVFCLHTKALSQAPALLRSTFFRAAAVKESKSFRGSSQSVHEFCCVNFDDRKKGRGNANVLTSSAPRRPDSSASTRSWRSSENATPKKPVQKFRNERVEHQSYPDGDDFRSAYHEGYQRSHDKAAVRRTERPRGRSSSSQSADFTPGAQPTARRSWRSAEPRRTPRTRNSRTYDSDNDQEEWNPRNRRAKETPAAARSEEFEETEEEKSRPAPTKFVEGLLPSASTSRVLLGLSASELSLWAQAHGLEAYRGKQIHQYLYEKGARSLSAIPVLSKAWRESDAASFPIGRSSVAHESIAPDGTRKFLLTLEDGKQIECVGIPTRDRLTVCVSTQVGCAMKCDFCATGKMGFMRDLSVAEIVDQVLTVQETAQRHVSHIVFMGMGEPLNNLTNVLQAVHVLNKDVGIGQRNMTISTVGIQGRIQELAQYQLQCTLAVSLHAPTQQLREAIIPSAKAYTYDMLINDCKLYVQATGRRISFEYTMLSGVNDASEHAIELAKRLRGFQCHVNLIPYNPISNSEYVRPSSDRLAKFLDVLQNHNIAASVRRTRGLDSDAACGQLTSSAGQSRAAQR